MHDDSELLRRFVENRSNVAFSELVQRYINLVYSTALRETRGDVHRAEEATQIVFIDFARKAPSLVGRTVLGGWLYLSVPLAVARLARSERRWRRREQEANAMHELNARSSVRDVDWTRLRPVIDLLLRDMREQDREALLLRFFEGQSFLQIGERLQLSEDTARKRVERALGKLQILLERRGIQSTSAALASVLATEAVTAAPSGLAGAATGAALAASSGAIGVFTFMSTTKLIVTIVGAAALVGGAGYALKQRVNSQQRQILPAVSPGSNSQGASSSGTELFRLQAENNALKQVRADLEARLTRNLRSQEPNNLPEGIRPIGVYKNAGKTTPAAAIGTLLWAINSQDVNTLASMIVYTPEARKKAEALFAGLPQSTRAELGSPNKLLATLFLGSLPAEPIATGVQMLESKNHNSGDVEMAVLTSWSDGTTRTTNYALLLQGDGNWGIRIQPAMVDSWARLITVSPSN